MRGSTRVGIGALALLPTLSVASTIYRASLGISGAEPNGDCYGAAVSGNGRYVGFASSASNLVPFDTNEFDDIFVYDRIFGTIERVSVSTNGRQGNYHSSSPSLSYDGRYVTFQTSGTSMVQGDTNGVTDCFVYDRLTRETTRVSVSVTGEEANDASSVGGISADGRSILFSSLASNLVPGDLNGKRDVFIHDRSSGEISIVSIASTGEQGNNSSSAIRSPISFDGRFVAFTSHSSNLVANDTNENSDIFLRDLVGGTTTRVSTTSSGVQAQGESVGSSISYDGRYVVFQSNAGNLVENDTNGKRDIFLKDVMTGQTTRVSVGTGGIESNADSDNGYISGNGIFVAFESSASNLSPEDPDQNPDIFIHDRLLGQSSVCSRPNLVGQSDGDSWLPRLSGDGSIIAFHSSARNLDPPDTNDKEDIFVHATNGQVLFPTNWQPIRGVLIGGNLASLFASDDDKMVFRPSVVLSSQQAPVEVWIETETVLEEIARIQLFVESSASASNVQITLALHDFVANQKVILGTSQSSVGDTTISRFTIGIASRFLGPGGKVRAILSWKATGPVLSYPWQCRIDHVYWAVSP